MGYTTYNEKAIRPDAIAICKTQYGQYSLSPARFSAPFLLVQKKELLSAE
jgi:hypothetical protein